MRSLLAALILLTACVGTEVPDEELVQQTYNIMTNGSLIDEAGVPLRDANGSVVATITNTCGRWVIGEDAQDQTVIIAIDTGEVRSHGTLHAGQETSSLAPTLAIPLTY